MYFVFYYLRISMVTQNKISFLKYFSTWRILIPIALGLSISGYMIGRSFDANMLSQLDWGGKTIFWIFIAVLCLLLRDFMNMLRLRILTQKKLSWNQSFQNIMLWEFGNTVMPAFIGGAGVALITIHKTGVPLGRSTAVVMISSLLDELYFIILIPLLLLVGYIAGIYGNSLFAVDLKPDWIVWGAYVYLASLAFFLSVSIFFLPTFFAKILRRIFSLKFLRRWKGRANRMGSDLKASSREMRGKSFGFWIQLFFVTLIAWISRFFIINCLIMAFMPGVNHFELYSRQLYMWVIMLASPTPGASGIAEWIFSDYLGMFVIVGLAPVLALIWRLLTFYYYLLVGSLVMPVWIRRVFK
ncbi:MAG: YbhN family protein [Bacteroidales bacterium]